MTKPQTARQCRGCPTQFPNPGNKRMYCTLECACWAKIDKRGPDECWPWQGAKTHFGYGSLRYENLHYYAHRVAYTASTGEAFAPKMEGCHRCDNPSCCNPQHIFMGTHLDNMRDMDAKGRRRTVAHKGEKCGASKLTESAVLAIRGEYASGSASLKGLAAKYGCGASSIGRIVRRTHWKHI